MHKVIEYFLRKILLFLTKLYMMWEYLKRRERNKDFFLFIDISIRTMIIILEPLRTFHKLKKLNKFCWFDVVQTLRRS